MANSSENSYQETNSKTEILCRHKQCIGRLVEDVFDKVDTLSKRR